MLEKKSKAEITVQIDISIFELEKLKDSIEAISEIEKEYNCNCTQIQINVKG